MTSAQEIPAPAASEQGEPILRAEGLVRHYLRRSSRGGLLPHAEVVHAVDGVSLALYAGRVTALIGESGSGKSTVSRLLSLLEWPTAGQVALNGQVVVSGHPSPVRRGRLLRAHSADVQLVFQDPFSSLNSNHTVGYHIERPLRIHRQKLGGSPDYRQRVVDLLEQVNLRPGDSYIARYPHELSGGQRQRVAIARALASEPSVLLADEPVSMLDVSVRLGVLALLDNIRRQRNLAVLYITHDIASAGYFADDAVVMYAGQLIEGGPASEVIRQPMHPYTQLLREAAPDPDKARDAPLGDVGEPPNLGSPPAGCRFHPRCPHVMPVCSQDQPPRVAVGAGRWAACWLYDKRPARAAAAPGDTGQQSTGLASNRNPSPSE
jgi:peptide/nickel transport system ATP-binding protein